MTFAGVYGVREDSTGHRPASPKAHLGRRERGTIFLGGPQPEVGRCARRLFIPVILGTPRKGRYSEHVARFVLEQASKRPDIETDLVDIATLHLPVDDAGEAVKDNRFSAIAMRADALILVVPEYNHGYPGLLKHLLDSNLKEYIHKAVGICGVSAGGFGGARVIQSLLPVMRELGLGP
jgi:NAD(P)H-dependent FMN reductase